MQDDDDFSGPALGGPIGVRSDSDDDDDDDAPPMMGVGVNQQQRTSMHKKKPFSMEVIDF